MSADDLDDLDPATGRSGSNHSELPGLDDPPEAELELDTDAMRRIAPPAQASANPAPMEALREIPSVHRPIAPPPPILSLEGDPQAGERIAHDHPQTTIATIPIAMFLGVAMSVTDFGSLLATPVSIQFHELGHAIAAILTGRAALPMPCGLTVWSGEPSLGIHLLLLLASGWLLVRGARDRIPLAVALGAAVLLAHLTMTFVVADQEAAILLAGGGGELVLPGLAMVSFYFRMPDRWRWDFFRFLVAPAGAIAYCLGMHLWLSVLSGRLPAPVGSFLGSSGDGSGDLDRLVHDHGRSLDAIVRGYVALGIVVGLAIVATYAVFAVRAIAALRDARDR